MLGTGEQHVAAINDHRLRVEFGIGGFSTVDGPVEGPEPRIRVVSGCAVAMNLLRIPGVGEGRPVGRSSVPGVTRHEDPSDRRCQHL